MRRSFVITATAIACTAIAPAATLFAQDAFGAKFEIPKGKLLHLGGQSKQDYLDYKSALDDAATALNGSPTAFPDPAGAAIYFSLDSSRIAPYIVDPNGTTGSTTNFDLFMSQINKLKSWLGTLSPTQFAHVSISFGRFGEDPSAIYIDQLLPQNLADAALDQLAAALKLHPGPLLIRPGFEPNEAAFYSSPAAYKVGFRYIVDYLREQGVDAAYIYCLGPNSAGFGTLLSEDDPSTPGIDETGTDWRYYPGDEYADYIGMDILNPVQLTSVTDPLFTNTQTALDFARERRKPVFLSETSASLIANGKEDPQKPLMAHPAGGTSPCPGTGFDCDLIDNDLPGGIIDDTQATADQVWAEFFDPFFEFMAVNEDVIRGFVYINTNWTGGFALWGNTDLGENLLLAQMVASELYDARYLHDPSTPKFTGAWLDDRHFEVDDPSTTTVTGRNFFTPAPGQQLVSSELYYTVDLMNQSGNAVTAFNESIGISVTNQTWYLYVPPGTYPLTLPIVHDVHPAGGYHIDVVVDSSGPGLLPPSGLGIYMQAVFTYSNPYKVVTSAPMRLKVN